MNRRQRHSRLSPRSGTAARDTEALQTDVMRFMAIISLCLMAVFALVQSIPVLEEGKASRTAQISGERQKTDTRMKPANESQVKLHAPEENNDRSQKVSIVTQQPPEKVSATRSEPMKRTRPAPVVKSGPGRQGFSLQFESAAALDQLVAAGSVILHAMVDQQAWRLSVYAGRPVIARSLLPAWFHEMSPATVPEHYIHSLDKVAGAPGTPAVVWGVQLPAATRAAIASLMRSPQGGVLVIRSDGQVALED